MSKRAPPSSIWNSVAMRSIGVSHFKNPTYNQKHPEKIPYKSKDILKAPDKITAKRKPIINNFV